MKIFSITLFSALIAVSCGYYSFKGALPSEIKTIAIPIFDNNTSDPNVRADLTDMLSEAFISDNSLNIVDEDKADLILTGSINAIRIKPFIVQTGENVSENQVIVTVHVKCRNAHTSKILFEKNLSEYGLMDMNAGLDERDAAIRDALKLITDKIVNLTLGGW